MKITNGAVLAITGASRGIGRAFAIECAQKGAKLILLSRDIARMNEVAERIQENGGEALVIECDVSDEKQCYAWVPKALDRFKKIDVLVNNAGYGHYASIEDLTTDSLQKIFATNLFGSFWCAKAVIPQMKKQGSGHIVNVSTIISRRSLPFMTAYCMTKFAMNAFDEGLRLELRRHNIGVSLVCPGLTRTEFQMNAATSGYKPYMKSTSGMSAERVGHAIFKAIESNRRRVELTWSGKFLLFAQRLWPSFVDEVVYREIVLKTPRAET